MYKKIVLIFLFLQLNFCFSQEIQRSYCDNTHILKFGEHIVTEKELDARDKEYKYKIEEVCGIKYLTLKEKKYLMIFDEHLLYLYDDNNRKVFSGCSKGVLASERISPINAESESSALIENNHIYSATKFNSIEISPWVEGVNGYGIGESISFSVLKNSELYISIGFLDYNRPWLYKQNSRPKKIRIYINNNFFTETELKDTPNFQKLNIQEGLMEQRINLVKIEITEVYKGSKYDDTCINMIIADESGIK